MGFIGYQGIDGGQRHQAEKSPLCRYPSWYQLQDGCSLCLRLCHLLRSGRYQLVRLGAARRNAPDLDALLLYPCMGLFHAAAVLSALELRALPGTLSRNGTGGTSFVTRFSAAIWGGDDRGKTLDEITRDRYGDEIDENGW